MEYLFAWWPATITWPVVITALTALAVAVIARLGNRKLEQLKTELSQINAKQKAELDKSIHIDRAKFDKEFEISQQLWGRVVALSDAVDAICEQSKTAGFDIINPDSKPAGDLLMAFIRTRKDLIYERAKYQPFYAEAIHTQLKELELICTKIVMDSAIGVEDGERTWEKIHSRFNALQDELNKAVNNLSEAIRKRIDSLTVS